LRRETKPGPRPAADPRRAQFFGVLVHPLAGHFEPLRDLLRVEPGPRGATLRDQHLAPHDLDDARQESLAQAVRELGDHCWVERQVLGASHNGFVNVVARLRAYYPNPGKSNHIRADLSSGSVRKVQICRYPAAMAIEQYNRRAIAVLERAQRLSEARSASAFARAIAALAGGSPSSTSYRRWITGEALVPAWALEAAAEVAGTTLAALVAHETEASPAAADWRAQMEDTIGRLQAEIIELRERLDLPGAARAHGDEQASPHRFEQRAPS